MLRRYFHSDDMRALLLRVGSDWLTAAFLPRPWLVPLLEGPSCALLRCKPAAAGLAALQAGLLGHALPLP